MVRNGKLIKWMGNGHLSYIYTEHILQMLTFDFIWPFLWSPLHGEPVFIKHDRWPYKSKKWTHYLFLWPLPIRLLLHVGGPRASKYPPVSCIHIEQAA